MFSAILGALTAIPKIVSLIESLISEIALLRKAQEASNLIAQEKNASAKATGPLKDSTDLENIYGNK